VPASGPESKSKAAPGRPGKGRLPGTVATAPKDPATDQSTGSERKDAAENPALPYAVTVSVTTTSGSLGALQFDVIHLGDSGNFVGKADSVDCSPQVEAALATGNNRRAGRLVFALVDVGGFETPSPIVTCTFKTRESLDPNSFDVYVVTATDTNGVPVMTDMTVSSVEPLY
jgi:hypothetical protein